MSEKALLFGRTRSLVGIVTDPARREAGERFPGVVILNAGVLHRVGPNRVHVQLARALAEAGFVVLRFDLSGIGDSRPRDGADTFATSVLREIREALDVLESTRGLRHFVIAGICSGADNGLRATLDDQRVVAAILIDGYNLPSLGFTFQLNRGRFLSPRSWARLLLGRSEVWSDLRILLRSRRGEQLAQTSFESIVPAPRDYTRQIHALLDRGAHLLLIYTGNSPAHFNYRRLLRKSLRSWLSRGQVAVEHFKDSDHTFTLLRDQRRLVRRVCEWTSALTRDPPPGAVESRRQPSG